MAIKGARPDERRVVAHLMVRDGAACIEWYTRVLGATELYRYTTPGSEGSAGRVFHAQLKIGESVVMMTDENMSATGRAPMSSRSPQTLNGTSVIMELYVEDADAAYSRALAAGAKVLCPLMDTFFGDRYGQVVDPFGHAWAFATVREWLTREEVARRLGAMMAAGKK